MGKPDAAQRRRQAVRSGHAGDEAAARALLSDDTPAVRASALGALARLGVPTLAELGHALSDADAAVRRRACRVAATTGTTEPEAVGLVASLVERLDDPDPTVVEVAAWALGERPDAGADAVARLSELATGADDHLCRESAVAALGAIGDPAGLPAILAATADKATVRRRAVIALAPFDGPEVDAALERARADKDWQVRQAAEDLS